MPAIDLSAFSTAAKFAPEAEILQDLLAQADLDMRQRRAISRRGADLVRQIREQSDPSLMEQFLAEYGLSSREGLALMSLAEALLRVPDAATMDALIEDKLTGMNWRQHLKRKGALWVNGATLGLMLAAHVLEDADRGPFRRQLGRLARPVIRTSLRRAMQKMGRHFVFAETIEAALLRAKTEAAAGVSYSFDMLGEAAMTKADAQAYATAYRGAIRAIAKEASARSCRLNPGISIKLSALHPRYEVAQEDRVMAELVPLVLSLAQEAKAARMSFTIDAEEQDRLVLSLKVIEAVLAHPSLAGWDGFGVVVQAYGKRAGLTLDWLYETATALDRQIMVRLVKGAYWDGEIKHAQVEGFPDFPVLTSKCASDVSYIANAKKLFGYGARIYPQFATHNAHSVAAILELAEGRAFEFQRLHGMGAALHDRLRQEAQVNCRIYAPVGAYRDLLAYLVRRLLENGANSSFVNQLLDESLAADDLARDPFEALATAQAPAGLKHPAQIFAPARVNARGYDLSDAETLALIQAARAAGASSQPAPARDGALHPVLNPATGEEIGAIRRMERAEVSQAIGAAQIWRANAGERAKVLRRAADLYEAHLGELFDLLAREAGKTLPDACAELREAVDFLRYYAAEGETVDQAPLGIWAAISPWNFPLAIFTGQIAAALMAGNGVLAKPAEATSLIALRAVALLHEAGVPPEVLQLLPGEGKVVGAALTCDPRIAGVVFTGSTATAQEIAQNMAQHLAPSAPLIAETGGLNAMIVDATALPEQALRDIVAGAFRSAGQRCSALRCVYVQEEIAPHLIELIKGAMDELRLGDPLELATDVGPVIDRRAQMGIAAYLATKSGQILHQVKVPQNGTFIPPSLLRVAGIEDLEREIFGPVLHLATFKAHERDKVIAQINARGFGLTFGLHSRIGQRAREVVERVRAGNIYVNRNQIGAVVGSQPFGGEGLSGTGPKAGGPLYLSRFYAPEAAGEWPARSLPSPEVEADLAALGDALARTEAEKVDAQILQGPTGELNRLSSYPRGAILCLGPGADAQAEQLRRIESLGGRGVKAHGHVSPESLSLLPDLAGAIWWGDESDARAYRLALSRRAGPIVQLMTANPTAAEVLVQRHLCIDTTAAGGNSALLGGSDLGSEEYGAR